MQKVISINLNGNAYQLDESGYEALREYLARAERQLEDNPDRDEIMADLEQAVADKCQRHLGSHKTVVAADEIGQILAEMGPVETDSDKAGEAAPDAGGSEKTAAEAKGLPRRLHRILDGAMIAGVCNGLAAHLQIDVTIVRVAFVGAALITKGVAILAYVILMFVIPEADTPEKRAAAGGPPFSARDVIERAKRQHAAATQEWRRRWRQQRRKWRRSNRTPGVPVAYGPPLWAAVLLPVFGLMHVAVFLAMAAMMISLVNTGAILDWPLPPDVPVWAAALILLIAYQIVVSPLRVFESWTSAARPGTDPGALAFWNAVTWLVGLAFVLWVASNHTAEIAEFVQRVADIAGELLYAIRGEPR